MSLLQNATFVNLTQNEWAYDGASGIINPTFSVSTLTAGTVAATALTGISSINGFKPIPQIAGVGAAAVPIGIISSTTPTLLFSTNASFTGGGGVASVSVPVRYTVSTFTGSGGSVQLGVVAQANAATIGPSFCAVLPLYPGQNVSTLTGATTLNTTIQVPSAATPLCVYAYPTANNGGSITNCYMSATNSATQGATSAAAVNTFQNLS